MNPKTERLVSILHFYSLMLSPYSPGLHKDSSKVDLSMEVNIQHLFEVVLMGHTNTGG